MFFFSIQCWQCWFYNTLQVFLSCLGKGKNWTEFGLESALVPWFGKKALRDLAEITSLIPFVTLHKHISQSWPDILMVITLTVSPGARPSALGDTAHGNHSDAYVQYSAVSSIHHFFSSWKILSRAAAPQNTSPARYFDLSLSAQNSGNSTKHLLMPTSFFYLETEMKLKLMSLLPTQHIRKIKCNKQSTTFRKFSRVVSLCPHSWRPGL